jgi:hypothetical protein
MGPFDLLKDQREVCGPCTLRRIWLQFSCFAPTVIMEVAVPNNRDAEEYIDELLDGILREDFIYNAEWDFCD